ncbi:hypothetical protein A3Q56_06914 [Intoshia linei]|uniref:Tr-type G domain-containing protein n=1 Tax=Intoshia linei TaxID=1819745 RepID=A0A177ATQ1_9BILA|nr:hypothetical protein A3Q56_06914 [Intoshia linei]
MNEKELIKNEEKIDYNIDRKEVYVEPSQPVMDLLCNDIEEKIYIRSGECILTIGLEGKSKERGITASQMELSLETLEKICTILKCKSTLILAEKLEDGNEIQHFLIRKNMINSIYIEVRIAILGNVDAGKTSFLGVLTLDQLDDGRGLTRGRLHQHLHEKTSGRTSSVSNYILGFNEDCDYVKPIKGKVDWKNVRINSSKIITFIDLAGHEKYFKTTVFGMTSNKPHHSVLVIGANAGIIGMTKEHLSLILALDLPLIIVVTKIDMCPQNILAETMSLIQKILKSPGCRKITVSIKSIKDVVVCIKEITNKRIPSNTARTATSNPWNAIHTAKTIGLVSVASGDIILEKRSVLTD